jgi:hypothetical protein
MLCGARAEMLCELELGPVQSRHEPKTSIREDDSSNNVHLYVPETPI